MIRRCRSGAATVPALLGLLAIAAPPTLGSTAARGLGSTAARGLGSTAARGLGSTVAQSLGSTAARSLPHTPPRAHAARAVTATDRAQLRYISASGSLLFEEGSASGTLPGSMRVHFNVGATLSGSFTIYTRGGTIKGHGEATPHGSGVYESFAGAIVATGGSGRFAHAHGHAKLYGTFNRNTYALLIQTTGTLSY